MEVLMHPVASIPGIILAYLDPGSGSYLIQLLIAALLGGGFAIKAFWKQISAFFRKLTGKSEPVEEENKDDQPQ
jgi:hypothetical protein